MATAYNIYFGYYGNKFRYSVVKTNYMGFNSRTLLNKCLLNERGTGKLY